MGDVVYALERSFKKWFRQRVGKNSFEVLRKSQVAAGVSQINTITAICLVLKAVSSAVAQHADARHMHTGKVPARGVRAAGARAQHLLEVFALRNTARDRVQKCHELTQGDSDSLQRLP